jgi:hypothetical protein
MRFKRRVRSERRESRDCQRWVRRDRRMRDVRKEKVSGYEKDEKGKTVGTSKVKRRAERMKGIYVRWVGEMKWKRRRSRRWRDKGKREKDEKKEMMGK